MCNPYAYAHAHANANGYRNTHRNSSGNAYPYAYPRTKWEILFDTETTPNGTSSSDAITLVTIEAENLATQAHQLASLKVNGQSPESAFSAA